MMNGKMSDLLSHTITVRSFLSALTVVCAVLILGTTLYWTTEMREAVEEEKHVAEQQVVATMQAQLNRIEQNTIRLLF